MRKSHEGRINYTCSGGLLWGPGVDQKFHHATLAAFPHASAAKSFDDPHLYDATEAAHEPYLRHAKGTMKRPSIYGGKTPELAPVFMTSSAWAAEIPPV